MIFEAALSPCVSKPVTLERSVESDGPDRIGWVRGLTRRRFHRIAFADWGSAHSARPVLCVHGLTRNGRDFDYLARALASGGRRVVCPDLPGRGQSDILEDSSSYVLPQYCSDMTTLIASIGAVKVDWVGTSLGGLIGMVLAALPGSPIRRIVINDIGPYLPWAGLFRLGSNLTSTPLSFETISQAEEYFRRVLGTFGALTDAQWLHLTAHSVSWDAAKSRSERCAIQTSLTHFAIPGITAWICGSTGKRSVSQSW